MAKLGDLFPDELLPPAAPQKPQLPAKPAAPGAAPGAQAGMSAAPAAQATNRPRPLINPPQQGGKATPPGVRPAPQILPGGEVRRMERTFIRELIAGQEIEGIFL